MANKYRGDASDSLTPAHSKLDVQSHGGESTPPARVLLERLRSDNLVSTTVKIDGRNVHIVRDRKLIKSMMRDLRHEMKSHDPS